MAIGSFTMPATRTRLRGIRRVYQPDLDTCPGRLIHQEQAQLKEGPGMPLVTVFALNRDLLPNAGQVFESQCLARYDGFVDQGLADGMVDGFHVAMLAPAHLLEATFGRFGSYLL